MERWVWGCAAQIRCFFDLSGLAMAPFLFENWFRYRSRFAKCIIFDEFVLWFTYRLSKSTYASQFTLEKYLSDLKRALQETNGLDIGSKFASSLV